MGSWTLGKVGWRQGCPQRMFSDLYFEPWFDFVGPSADGSSLWTFQQSSEELQEWSAADLSLLTTLTPTVDTLDGVYAIGPTYAYYVDIDSFTSDKSIRRADLTTGSSSSIISFGSDDPTAMTYCHVDDRLYVVVNNATLVRYEPDGSGATTMVAATADFMLSPVWTRNYVWVLRGTGLVRVRISDGDVTTIATTPGATFGNALHSNGAILGQFAQGIDYPGFPDNDNWYFRYRQSGSETIINNNVHGVLFAEEVPGHGLYVPSPPNTQGGFRSFVFSGEIAATGDSVSSGPYPGKQDATGTSWFVSDYGTYGALWRF